MLNITVKMQLSARDKKEKTVVSKVTNELYSGNKWIKNLQMKGSCVEKNGSGFE